MNRTKKIRLSAILEDAVQKRDFNEWHFTRAAPYYDLVTRILSGGRDSGWKHFLIDLLPNLSNPTCIDLACGTGDLTFRLAERYPKGRIIGLDITKAMLDIAKKRNVNSSISFVQADMCPLQFSDGFADIITGSYALRNAPDLRMLVNELRRVLKPGAVAAFLEFSKGSSRIASFLEQIVLKGWGSFWGLVLHGDSRIHGYIAASLAGYPSRRILEKMFHESDLNLIKRQLFCLGMVEVFVIQKGTTVNYSGMPPIHGAF